MTNDIDKSNKPRNNGKVLIGMILLVIGVILFTRQLGLFFFPAWIWSWPTWVIIWGIWVGVKHDFRKPIWIFLIFIGVLGMLNYIVPGLNIGNLIFPLIVISVGILIILKRNNRIGKHHAEWQTDEWKARWEAKHQYYATGEPADTTLPPEEGEPAAEGRTAFNYARGGSHYGDDFLDTVAVFSGAKKTILSKDFKGGEIVNVFGGTELDFTQADINGRVILDITQIFGGTKLVVPSNWQVVSDIASVFAGVDDKRMRNLTAGDPNKVLVLKGTSIFAGVDIRSF